MVFLERMAPAHSCRAQAATQHNKALSGCGSQHHAVGRRVKPTAAAAVDAVVALAKTTHMMQQGGGSEAGQMHSSRVLYAQNVAAGLNVLVETR
jgi:hypothetical protein